MTPEEFETGLGKAFPYAFRMVQDKGPQDMFAAFKSAAALPDGALRVWFWASGEKDFPLTVRKVEKREEQDWLLTTDDDIWEIRRMPSERLAREFHDAVFNGDF